jgi:hypothetical protein
MLAIAALAVGCGDDATSEAGEDSGGNGASISKAELIERAQDVCARSKRRFSRELASYVPPETKGVDGVVPSADTFAGAFEEVGLPVVESQAAALSELAKLRDDEDFTGYLAALDEALANVERQAEVTGPEFLSTFERSTEMARAYGVPNCALG